jgi:hypothetical protein
MHQRLTDPEESPIQRKEYYPSSDLEETGLSARYKVATGRRLCLTILSEDDTLPPSFLCLQRPRNYASDFFRGEPYS